MTLRLKAGAATEPAMAQTLFRLGGLGTVRGFEYGTLRAPAFWAAQLDVTPFGARVRPVIFLDAGQASRISGLFSSSALVGGGVGLSLFSGLIRFDLSHPISPDQSGKVRFDLVIRGAR
jgi:hemolysin activation/secretion protein